MAFAFEPATIALLVVMGSSCGIMSQFTTEVILTRGSDVFGIFSRKKHSLNTYSTLFPHGHTTSWLRFNENNEISGNLTPKMLERPKSPLHVTARSQDLKRHRSRSCAGGARAVTVQTFGAARKGWLFKSRNKFLKGIKIFRK